MAMVAKSAALPWLGPDVCLDQGRPQPPAWPGHAARQVLCARIPGTTCHGFHDGLNHYLTCVSVLLDKAKVNRAQRNSNSGHPARSTCSAPLSDLWWDLEP